MDISRYGDEERQRRAALEITQSWPAAKAAMALRAAGLSTESVGESLDAIAADAGKSRETVRRARNALYTELDAIFRPSELPAATRLNLPVATPIDAEANFATGRALRRVLTMTGPLPFDEVLTAWARAGGKPPYTRIPTDTALFRRWADTAGGMLLGTDPQMRVTIAVAMPEDLDQVSQYLFGTLRGRPTGVDRALLLEAAASAGLKPTTIATTLSQHPAVMRLGRGTWALRGQQGIFPTSKIPIQSERIPIRARPTSFNWASDGSLRIEFSLPRGPSPVIAVPKAVAELVDGREFTVNNALKPTRLSVRNARLWGFGALVSELGLVAGARATMTLNLITGTADVTPVGGRTPEDDRRHS